MKKSRNLLHLSGCIRKMGITICNMDIYNPSVKYCADAMNLSPDYFSDMLKSETGKNTQEHIHYILTGEAKNKLVNSKLSINEIAWETGFEYPQNFGKLFKKKVSVSQLINRLG